MAQLEIFEGQWRAAQDRYKHKKRAAQQMESDMKVRNNNVPSCSSTEPMANFQVVGKTLSSLKADESKLTTECTCLCERGNE
jgi:hypothetical protein